MTPTRPLYFNRLLRTAITATTLLLSPYLAFSQAPSNDNFVNRAPMTGGTAQGTNVDATRETGEPDHAGHTGGKSVWWTWTADSSGNVTIDTVGSNFDTLLAVYTGTSINTLASVGFNDDSGLNGTSKVSFDAIEGTDYQIAVDGFSGAAGAIQLAVTKIASIAVSALPANQGTVSGGGSFPVNSTQTVTATPSANYAFLNWTEAGAVVSTSASYQFTVGLDRKLVANFGVPPNDNFANSATLSGTSKSSNLYATKELGEPNHAGYSGGHSLWWNWTAPASGEVFFSTAGSSFYNTLAVYTGTSVASLTPVGFNNGNNYSWTSSVTLSATAGTTYQIAVDSMYSYYTGSIQLSVTPSATISVSASPVGEGTVSGGGTIALNSTQTVTASPNYGYTFINWTEAGTVVSTSPSYQFVATADRTLVANFTSPLAPSNDSFASSATLSGSATGSNVYATKEPGEPNHAGYSGGHSLWWNWTAPASETVIFSTAGSNFYNTLAVYTGTALNSLTPVGINNGDYYSSTSRVILSATAGTTYQIAVDGMYSYYNGSIQLSVAPAATISASVSSVGGGTVSGGGTVAQNSMQTVTASPYYGYAFINWTEAGTVVSTSPSYQFLATGDRTLVANFALPSNDNFANSAILSGTATSTNVYASKEQGEPYHAGNQGGRSLWWNWTAPESRSVSISTAGSDFYNTLAVYTGTAVDSLTPVASAYNGYTSAVTFNAIKGTTYQIAVDGYLYYSYYYGYYQYTGNIRLALTPLPTIFLIASPDGAGSFSGGGGFDLNTTHTVTASPNSAYSFTNWTEAGTVVSTSPSYQFVATGDRTLVANFSLIPAPANDNFANRPTITDTAAGSNANATREPGEPEIGGASGKSAWWTWTAPVSGVASVDTAGSNFNAVIGIYTGSSVDALTQVAIGQWNLTFNAIEGTTYQISVDGYSGEMGSIQLTVTPPPGPQIQLPSLTIRASKTIVVPVQFVATGDENTISFSINFDSQVLTSPKVKLGAGARGAALSVDMNQAGDGSLGIVITQPAGHTFTSGAQDLADISFHSLSGEASVGLSFGDSPTVRLVLDRNGNPLDSSYTDGGLDIHSFAELVGYATPEEGGSVSGGGVFKVGSTHSITAMPTPGWMFVGWDDGVKSKTRKVTLPTTDVAYTAQFVLSPSRWKGSYNGNLNDSDIAGLVNLTLDSNGGFSASIKINGHSYPLHGKMDADGTYTGTLHKPAGWGISLQMDYTDGVITGSLSNGDSSLDLYLSRSLRDSKGDISSLKGKYTFLLQQSLDYYSSFAQCQGFGNLTVAKTGAIRMTGRLSDGTTFTQGSSVTQDNTWNLYVPIYLKTGYVSGTINFDALDGSDLDGSVTWFKPPRPKDVISPLGFSSEVSLIGSKYIPSFSFSNSFIQTSATFWDSNQDSVFSETFSLAKGANQLGTMLTWNNQSARVSVNPSNGTFTGSLFGVYLDAQGKPISTPLQGVILQKTNTGGGYFFDGVSNGWFQLNY